MNRTPQAWRTVALKLALVLLATFLLLEVGARFLMFSSAAQGLSLAARMRQEDRYGFGIHDSEYWRLQYRFLDPERRRNAPGHDPLLGWNGRICRPGDYLHHDAPQVGARRPVLLYGDSFSMCLTGPGDCFQGLLARSPLAETHALINYGVGGYGLDQTYLMLEASIDAWAERDPVVLVGLLVDENLDRCAVDFRGWPKPQLELADGALRPRAAVPEVEEYFRQRSPVWTSFGLRFLRYGAELWPQRSILEVSEASTARVQAVSRAIFQELVLELERRELDYVFVLFYGELAVRSPNTLEWRDELVTSTLDELGAPWVSTRHALLQEVAAGRAQVQDFYGGSPKIGGHLNARGNQVAFHALLDGIEGYYGERRRVRVLSPAIHDEVVLRGADAVARFEDGLWGPFQSPAEKQRLCFRVGQEGPVEMVYRLGGQAQTFRARARFIPLEQFTPEQGSVGLTLVADGETLLQRRLQRSDAPAPIQVDLAGREQLTIRVDDAGDGTLGDLIVLTGPSFE